MQDTPTFRLNGSVHSVAADISPTMTLLEWLRREALLTGTKEGCAEGDCGACTVVIEDDDGSRLTVNSCLLMLGQVHGKTLRTIEGLRSADGTPHRVQRQFAEAHVTQCGFCTTAFVLAAWAFATEGGDLHEALAGNLCRCTGYTPTVAPFLLPATPCVRGDLIWIKSIGVPDGRLLWREVSDEQLLLLTNPVQP